MLKAALLHRKTYAFATSNRNYHFLPELSLQSKVYSKRLIYYFPHICAAFSWVEGTW